MTLLTSDEMLAASAINTFLDASIESLQELRSSDKKGIVLGILAEEHLLRNGLNWNILQEEQKSEIHTKIMILHKKLDEINLNLSIKPVLDIVERKVEYVSNPVEKAIPIILQGYKLVSTVNKIIANAPQSVHALKLPEWLGSGKSVLGFIGQGIGFFKFPATCLFYAVRKKFGIFNDISPPPSPPWESKHGWVKFILSTSALAIGITALALPGLSLPLAVAAASITFVKGVIELAKVIHTVHQAKKELEAIDVKIDCVKIALEAAEKNLRDEEVRPLEESITHVFDCTYTNEIKIKQLRFMQLKIHALQDELCVLNCEKNSAHLESNKLSDKKTYIDIVEKAVGTGVALISLMGAIICLANPFVGSIIGFVAVCSTICVSIYQAEKWFGSQWLQWKKTCDNSQEVTDVVNYDLTAVHLASVVAISEIGSREQVSNDHHLFTKHEYLFFKAMSIYNINILRINY